MSIVEWVLSILNGVLVIAAGGGLRWLLENERRLSVLESDRAHLRELLGQRMDVLEEKGDELVSKLESLVSRRRTRES